MTDKTEAVILGLESEIDRLTDEAWQLHSKLAKKCLSPNDQLLGMIELGERAKKIQQLQVAVDILSDRG